MGFVKIAKKKTVRKKKCQKLACLCLLVVIDFISAVML